MPDFKPSPLGVLKCRNLCTLYFGFPMVTSIIEGSPNPQINTTTPLIAQDPRRIKYEIVLGNKDAAIQFISIGSFEVVDGGNALTFALAPGEVCILERDFLTELDAVTLALWFQVTSLNCEITTREVFLTPAPVDVVGPTP